MADYKRSCFVSSCHFCSSVLITSSNSLPVNENVTAAFACLLCCNSYIVIVAVLYYYHCYFVVFLIGFSGVGGCGGGCGVGGRGGGGDVGAGMNIEQWYMQLQYQ